MPNRSSLDPEQRTLYGANLQSPAGYVFDAAVATTLSLDFATALAVPVSLALFAAENRDKILQNPLALLEGAERIAGRLLVFTDAEHIQAQTQPHSRLCSLLERVIVEVAAPNGGAFHPKTWALRFKPLSPNEPMRLRLLVLSRNLTRDRSWDIAVTLDGQISRRPQALNRPLSDFIRRLPDLATTGLPEGARDLTGEIAEDVRRTEWSLPDPFDNVAFAVNGLGGKQWFPERCARLGVISPFCDDRALSMLAGLADAKPVLIGRPDELAMVPGTTLSRFGRVAVLDEHATTEDGEEPDTAALQGLHAKAFVAEMGRWDTVITVGSGNATVPALVSGSNVELFATLTGRRSRVGSVDEILGETGFGRLTRPFVPGETPVPDPILGAAEARLDKARKDICRSSMKLRFERAQSANEGSPLWRTSLIPSAPLPLLGIASLRVWPITRGEGNSRDALEMLRLGQPVDLGEMPLIDLTRFLAFNLTDKDSERSRLFSAGFIVDGLPTERHAAILRWVIDSKDKFFSYLRMLLADQGDPLAAVVRVSGSDHERRRMAVDDAPILEEMVRSFCRGSDQLGAIERLITRLEPVDGLDPIPAEFRSLWDTFRIALKAQRGAHAR